MNSGICSFTLTGWVSHVPLRYFCSNLKNGPLCVDELEKVRMSGHLMSGRRTWKTKMDWIFVPADTLVRSPYAVHELHNCMCSRPHQG